MTGEPERMVRRCARVLLVDEDDRLLLFYSRDYMGPDVEYYVTPGGGLDAGETLAEGAAREVFEETGLRIEPGALGPVVAESEGAWSDSPDLVIESCDAFFFLRVPHFDPVRDRLEEIEQAEFTEARWLTFDRGGRGRRADLPRAHRRPAQGTLGRSDTHCARSPPMGRLAMECR